MAEGHRIWLDRISTSYGTQSKPFAKSTLQLFRAQLILHEKVRAVFQRSLQFARQTGYLKGHRMKAAVDTSYILGLGAVKDTYNLLADGVIQVVQALAVLEGKKAEVWAREHGLERYFGSSIKGEAEMFQLLLVATVANLTLVATKMGMMREIGHKAAYFLASFHQYVISMVNMVTSSWWQFLGIIHLLRQPICKPFLDRGSRLDF